MTQKRVIVILAAVCLILAAVSVIALLNRDKIGPQIHINESLRAYAEDQPYSVLLEGVTATDDVDGDVSDTLRVDGVIVLSDSKQVKIVYSAKDRSNNVSKADVILSYTAARAPDEPDAGAPDQGDGGTTLPAGNDAPDIPDNTTSGDALTDILNTDHTPLVSTGDPVIRLNTYRKIWTLGDVFQPLDYVDSAVDDKDDASRRIRVEGDYDINVEGTYNLQYYIIDSDGNRSNIEVLELVVVSGR